MSEKNLTTYSTPPEGMGKAGAIVNIIFASIALACSLIACLVLLISIIGILFIPFVILWAGLDIWALVVNILFLKGKDNKTMAGVLGIFVSIIGGILVLVSD